MPAGFSVKECTVMAGFFGLLSNPIRLRMFCALQDGPRTVSELAQYAEVSLPNASQHLRLMRDRGIVEVEKQAQRVYYRVLDARFLQAARMMREAVSDAVQRRADVINTDH